MLRHAMPAKAFFYRPIMALLASVKHQQSLKLQPDEVSAEADSNNRTSPTPGAVAAELALLAVWGEYQIAALHAPHLNAQ